MRWLETSAVWFLASFRAACVTLHSLLSPSLLWLRALKECWIEAAWATCTTSVFSSKTAMGAAVKRHLTDWNIMTTVSGRRQRALTPHTGLRESAADNKRVSSWLNRGIQNDIGHSPLSLACGSVWRCCSQPPRWPLEFGLKSVLQSRKQLHQYIGTEQEVSLTTQLRLYYTVNRPGL